MPNPALPNTFVAQAYDLDDEWGPATGPCFDTWMCCGKKYNASTCNSTSLKLCEPACAADADTATVMGGIHPRSKKPVGDRLGRAAYNTIYGGTRAYTGPTLAGCSLEGGKLTIRFNTTLLRDDQLKLQPIVPQVQLPGRHAPLAGGSQLYVQTNASQFCMEPQPVFDASGKPIPGLVECPTWAGGNGQAVSTSSNLDQDWIWLNFTLASPTSVQVDLTPLNGSMPTAVRYAWGITDCCDYTDPTLFVTHGCIATCPIMSTSGLPANPFQAKIVNGKCECVAPQVCDG